jgi:hypothetical protein
MRRRFGVLETLAVRPATAGPGRKHTRKIRLEPRQEVLVKEATEDFVRGLIHSDGCRIVANDRGGRSIRYHFSNRSEDILELFTSALDDLDIPWTRSSKKIVSIYRKAATARLNEVRRAEVLSGTVVTCPLRGVGGRHWSCW